MKREQSAPARRLGLVRAVVGGYTLVYLLKQRKKFRRLGRTDPSLFAPVGPVCALRKPLPAPVADALLDATVASSALFTLGTGHRLVGPLHSALLTWTLSYRNSWSMVYHSENTLVLHTLLLGASRAADAVSLDALARRTPAGPAHPRYEWPLRAMRAASAATYLLAGVAKVAGPSGWSWVDGAGMRRQVAIDRVRKDVFGSARGSTAAYQLYRHQHLFTAFAVGSLALEMGAPLGLVHPKAGRLWAVATFGMHWGIRVIMGIRFRYQLSGASFAPWLELEKLAGLAKWLGRR
ncbi:hypothetical protein GCM10023321_43400 [Pseudonocardia eucalypti]|uniref:HTTM domain-containing protein n=1 Tax=Pseudonocardia eucalypti TaxID=648755 RepID=A0ABP9QEF9_9PSEU|nr:hypothetical protein [Pseudonocardia eucalypti]